MRLRRVGSAWRALCRNRHDGADRLDPEGVAMDIDEAQNRGRRSSSACAKYADALRKISFMRFSSRTSRSNAFARWRSAVVRPPRIALGLPDPSVSAVHPSLPAIDSIAAHSDLSPARGPSLALVLRGNTDSVVTWLQFRLKEKALGQTR